jgi:cytoskeletal protein CcmA (bactofilin family)
MAGSIVLNGPSGIAHSDLPKPATSAARPTLAAVRTEPSGDSGGGTSAGTSVIGSDLTILGDKITIISKNRLQVDGNVRGDVRGRQVTISKEGSVSGQVWAEKIEVRGAVNGSIRAVAVTLHNSAKVDADIMHQRLAISEGAEFGGSVSRVADTSALMPVLDADAPVATSAASAPEPIPEPTAAPDAAKDVTPSAETGGDAEETADD